jgi:type IV secretory pathway VirB2 component (pilin)
LALAKLVKAGTRFYLLRRGVSWRQQFRRELSKRDRHANKRTKETAEMRPLWSRALRFRKVFRQLTVAVLGLLLAAPAFAQGASPWENAVGVLQQAFTSTIARGLSLVAIVVSGLTFAFGEGGSKRVLAGVLFGVGMAIAAVNFMAWLFP